MDIYTETKQNTQNDITLLLIMCWPLQCTKCRVIRSPVCTRLPDFAASFNVL